jgi:hypothetical protein
VGLHDRIRDEGGSDLSTSKPTAIETLNSLLSRIDAVELDVYLSLL